ncbi:ABC transporter permease [Granulicella tundricola]|uniref:Uncharacterized protein n=1 Tax=Granulicella tundricola (strain ATCC BAA-1859 / DSM 23138 / MP5ACTX9) TaxID=1198114 RepID=E8X0J2_GRATM|nr:ABC transporter permease [Granulicella tundricola]ADW67856.1 hypothetical protein AciX9_0787 [Granulicella tundricola MP5ACTX9]
MPQSILIFRKDIRHLLPELGVVLLLFVAFASCAPSMWTASAYAPYMALLAVLLKVLMPISWVVLISRLVHDESLVGDRQFWTSRPYHWGKLLAAKILFLAVFIYLPFLLVQCYLLKHAGLHPLLALPALGHNLVLLTICVILPITALAAITSNFARLLLSVIGAIIYMLVVSGFVFYFAFLKMQLPHLQADLLAVFFLLPAVALVYQYKTRQTQRSRILLIATPIAAALIVLLPASPFIAGAYPTLSGASAPKLTSLTDQFHPPTAGTLAVVRNLVGINLPTRIEGVAEDSTFVIQGVRVTVTGGGVNYTSPFLSSQGSNPIGAKTPATLLEFSLPQDIFNRIRTTPVDIHLELATERFQMQKPATWKATLLPFSVPGNGICSFSKDDASSPPTCRFPLAPPEVSLVTADVAPRMCPATQAFPGRANLGARGGVLDFDPVITVPLSLRTGDPDPSHNYVLCPGTPLSFVEGTHLPNAILTLDQKQVVLDAFAIRLTPPTEGPAPTPQVQPTSE